MTTTLYLPGDEQIDLALAEYTGYFWCRYLDGLVAGQRVVRFLISPEQFEQARKEFGPTGIVIATKEEPIEQLAFRSVPAFHASRDEMAKIEEKLYQNGISSVYLAKLRELIGGHSVGLLTEDELWRMLTASAQTRARAAFIIIDSQRPKQQNLFG